MPVPKLNDVEARVLGVLVEKAFTTPDQYPLSVNAIRNGCNQKSNRDPVTDYVEAEVVVGLQGLVPKYLALKVHEVGSRVEKYRHQAQHTLALKDGETAVLAELLLRGPQAQGELRARVHRMVPTPSLEELQQRLDVLTDKGYVARIAPAPGSRAARYAQLLGPRESAPVVPAAIRSTPASVVPAPGAATPDLEHRVQRLEEAVRALEARLERRGLSEV